MSFLCKPVFLSQNTIDSIVHAASLHTYVITCHITLCRPPCFLFLSEGQQQLFPSRASPCLSFPRNFTCLLITKTYHSYLISHMSVHHFLQHHCHHPLYSFSLSLYTLGSILIFSTNPFPIVLLTFHPSGPGQSPAAKRILVHFRHKFVPFQVPK